MSRLTLWLLALALLFPRALAADSREEMGAYYQAKITECEVREGRFKERVVSRLVILNKRGDWYCSVGAAKPPAATIKGLKATVYAASGQKVYERKGKDFLRAKGYGAAFELYNDMKIYETECSPPSYPYLIELEYELEYNSLFYWRGTQCQESIPVDSFDYRLKIHAEVPYSFRASALIPDPARSTDGDWTNLHWHASDLPAFDWRAFVPGLHEPAALKFVAGNLKLAKFELSELSWDGVGGWYRSLAADRYLAGAEYSPTGPTPPAARDTARQIYREIIDNSRYVAVSIGLSGWRPAAANETVACGYGDCKGLSTLLVSRLRIAGIAAYPALVLTRDRGLIDPTFPEFGFNHLIAVAIIDGDTLWMDPTCATCPFGEIPQMDEDIPVLLIGDTESRIVRTTASRPEDNAMTSRSTITVQPDGHAVIETAVSVRGNLAQQLRYALPHMDRGETDRFCQSMLITSAETELVEHHQENLRAIDKPLVIRLKARTTRPFHVIDSCRYVSLPLLDGACRRILQDFDTTLPAVDFRFPTRKLDSVTIVVAESPESSLLLPDAIDRTWSFGRVAMAGTVDGGRATMTMERVSFGYRVTQDEFPLLLEFCETVSTLTRSAIVVCRSE